MLLYGAAENLCCCCSVAFYSFLSPLSSHSDTLLPGFETLGVSTHMATGDGTAEPGSIIRFEDDETPYTWFGTAIFTTSPHSAAAPDVYFRRHDVGKIVMCIAKTTLEEPNVLSTHFFRVENEWENEEIM